MPVALTLLAGIPPSAAQQSSDIPPEIVVTETSQSDSSDGSERGTRSIRSASDILNDDHLDAVPGRRHSVKERLLYRLFHHDTSNDPKVKSSSSSILHSDTESEGEEGIPIERKSSPLAILSNKIRRSSVTKSHGEVENHLHSSEISSMASSVVSSASSSIFSSLKTSGSMLFHKRNDSETSLEEKYGHMDKHSLGKGANSVVRLAHKREVSQNGKSCERLYAVKEFRKRHDSESAREYIKKVTAEFVCVAIAWLILLLVYL